MDLVILAGGMGSRFGGLKQIQPVDDDNNFIIDYSVHDAVKAGFDRVIFVIKEENYEIFKSTIGNRLNNIVKVEYVFQRLDDIPEGVKIPEGRVKPWGTAHAIYATRNIVSDRFAIINADDFYGYEPFKLMADFLNNNKDNEFVSAGYVITNTMSDKGSVKRGIFTEKNGYVVGLTESEVEYRDGKVWATPLDKNDWKEISDKTLVSMNMFGFTNKLIDKLNADIDNFFKQDKLEKAEYLIPLVVNDMMRDNEITLSLKMTTAKWYGITYKEELEGLKAAIKAMVNNGEYPDHLY
jgi:NDP-sugar pyrophosphorylase family protein